MVANGLVGERVLDSAEVLIPALEFPFVISTDEMDQDIVMEERGEFFEIGRVDAAKIGMLELANSLHVHQHLDALAKVIGPSVTDFQGKAVLDANALPG